MPINQVNIFGVNITLDDYPGILDKIWQQNTFSVGCVNQHYLNLAYNDSSFRNSLNKIDLIHSDGIGVSLATMFISNCSLFPKRITGSDLYFKILKRLNNDQSSIFLLGDSENVLQKCVAVIEKQFPKIIIKGTHHGYFDLESSDVIKRINELTPDFLFVGLGGKRQELWINNWREKLKVKKIIAAGGGFRVIGKDRLRGPKFIQVIGLEWLIRLLSDPITYWRRYLIGVPLFVIRIIKQKIKNRCIYENH